MLRVRRLRAAGHVARQPVVARRDAIFKNPVQLADPREAVQLVVERDGVDLAVGRQLARQQAAGRRVGHEDPAVPLRQKHVPGEVGLVGGPVGEDPVGFEGDDFVGN